MKTLTDEQIIEKFKNASLYISKEESKGRENGIITVIYNGLPSCFPTYYTAYDFFSSRNLI